MFGYAFCSLSRDSCDLFNHIRDISNTAPSHYLNQCWNIADLTTGNKLQWNFNQNPNIFIQENAFENVVCEMASNLSRPRCVKIWARHDDVIKWKHFPRYWPFVRGIPRSPVNSPHKGQWRGALMFSLISTVEQIMETLVIWDATALIMTSL